MDNKAKKAIKRGISGPVLLQKWTKNQAELKLISFGLTQLTFHKA